MFGPDDLQTGNLADNKKAPLAGTGKLFWNVYNNIHEGIETTEGYDYNRELLTYIQADDRYLTYLEDYLQSDNGLDAAKIDELRAAGQKAHEDSYRVLEETPGYSTDMQGLANDFFVAIDREAFEQIGKLADEPAEDAEVVTDTTPIAPEDAPIQLEEIVVEAEEEPVELGTIELPYEEEPVDLGTIELDVEEPGEETTASVPEMQEYEVARGDNLWKIAKEYYGLESDKDIMKAVESIAHANGMEKGADANSLKVGQKIMLPDSPSGNPDQTLDWAALDRDTAARKGASASLQSGFKSAASGIDPVVANNDIALTSSQPKIAGFGFGS